MVKACRWIHRHLSFFFAGIVIIYALSGILMNHRDEINPTYSARRIELPSVLAETPRAKGSVTVAEIETLLGEIGERGRYTKHYYPDERTMKVFLKGAPLWRWISRPAPACMTAYGSGRSSATLYASITIPVAGGPTSQTSLQ